MSIIGAELWEFARPTEVRMDARYNVWLEKDGIVVMSLWRANFLKAIAASRSLKSAADQMECSYHEAQLKLDEMENGLGYKLVTYIPCDEGKDEIELTAEGEKLLRDFEEFSANFEEDVRNKMREKFQWAFMRKRRPERVNTFRPFQTNI